MGKVRGDSDMIFYGQTRSDNGNVSFRSHDSDVFFDINLPAQPANVDKIALAFSSAQTLSQIGVQGSQVLLTCQLNAAGRKEKAIILAECYRRQDSWKSSSNLTKRDYFDKISVNLNWIQRPNTDPKRQKKAC